MARPDHPRRCSRCGKRIAWYETERGHHQALDPDPNPRGNVVLQRARAESGVFLGGVRAHTLRKDEDPGEVDRYMPHSATCVALSQERAG